MLATNWRGLTWMCRMEGIFALTPALSQGERGFVSVSKVGLIARV